MGPHNITAENYGQFKKQYQAAVSRETKSFMFEGCEVLTAYAKYVVEYCNMIIKGGKNG